MSEQQQIHAASNAPEWAISEKAIHEVLFCKIFQQQHPIKCINGRFYDIDGLIPDDTIRSEIAGMLTPIYATQISRKVRDLFEAMKMFSFSEPIPVEPDEIHLLNGVLKTDGTWKAENSFASIGCASTMSQTHRSRSGSFLFSMSCWNRRTS